MTTSGDEEMSLPPADSMSSSYEVPMVFDSKPKRSESILSTGSSKSSKSRLFNDQIAGFQPLPLHPKIAQSVRVMSPDQQSTVGDERPELETAIDYSVSLQPTVGGDVVSELVETSISIDVLMAESMTIARLPVPAADNQGMMRSVQSLRV
jgi:hypothetical protein